MTSDVRQDIEAFLISVLDLTEPIDWSTVQYQHTPAWDSLVHMALLDHIERTYALTLTADEVTAMTGHDAVLDVLGRRGLHVN